jgi:hypothetical protein
MYDNRWWDRIPGTNYRTVTKWYTFVKRHHLYIGLTLQDGRTAVFGASHHSYIQLTLQDGRTAVFGAPLELGCAAEKEESRGRA